MKCLVPLIFACAVFHGNPSAAAPKAEPKGPAPRVHGGLLLGANGKPIRLQGVNIPSLEWSNAGDSQMMRSVEVAMDDWAANCIRLPLSQDRWFGKAEGQTDGGAEYRKVLDGLVRAIAARKGYAVLDLHWSDAGEWGKDIAQHWMPDANSVTFWLSVARRYANDPSVLFDLYNEPHDVSWDTWRNGGIVNEEGNGKRYTYRSPGLQGLLDAIRATGARNAVVAGGLDWAYDLTGVVNGYALSDPKGNGVLYGTHIYPWKRDWEGKVAVLSGRYPVFVGEVGCEPDPKQEDPAAWAPKVLAFIQDHGFHWTAWCFHPDASPRMLKGWDYAPTPYWGEPARAALRAKKGPLPR